MFTYLQPSIMTGDVIYEYYLKRNQKIFFLRYDKALSLLNLESPLNKLLSLIPDDLRFWKDVAQPSFFYWMETYLSPALDTTKIDKLKRSLDYIGNFFVIPFLTHSIDFEELSVVADEEGRVVFPGFQRYIQLQESTTQYSAILRKDGEYIKVITDEGTKTIPIQDFIDLSLRSLEDCGNQHVLSNTKIILGGYDPILLDFINNEMSTAVGTTLGVSLEDTELHAMHDPQLPEIWYYEKCMDTIKSVWPEMYEEAIAHIRNLFTLRTNFIGGATFSLVQGSTFLSHRSPDMIWSIENMIHEFSHSRLDMLFELDPLCLNEMSERYYSPWRTDLRPIKGIVHGSFVFCRIALWYERLIAVTGSYDLVVRQQKVITQLVEALDVLKIHGQFTALGEALIREMNDLIDRLSRLYEYKEVIS